MNKIFVVFAILFSPSIATAADSHLVIDGIHLSPRGAVEMFIEDQQLANGITVQIVHIEWNKGSRRYKCVFIDFSAKIAAVESLRKSLSEDNQVVPVNILNKHGDCDHHKNESAN